MRAIAVMVTGSVLLTFGSGCLESQRQGHTGEADGGSGIDTGAWSGNDTAGPSADAQPDAATWVDVIVQPGCCQDDGDCGGDLVCVGGEYEDGGLCLPRPADWACYDDQDCGPGAVCVAAQVCSCSMNCPSIAGQCEAVDSCCFTDDMCPAGEICRGGGAGGFPGTCVPPPESFHCWDSQDCDEGSFCFEADVAHCEGGGQSYTGGCVPIDIMPGCCWSDADCSNGQACAQPVPTEPGVCTAPLAPEECWTDADCQPGGTCSGVMYCPCGHECGAGMAPGDCQAPLCESSDDCVAAVRLDQCCSCYEAVTMAEVVADPCLVTGPPTQLPECAADCSDVDCDECPPLGPALCAPDGDCFIALTGGVCDGNIAPGGLGEPCNASVDCEDNSDATMCGPMAIPFGEDVSAPFCTHYCADDADCGPMGFCFPAGYSSTCIPLGCEDTYAPLCTPSNTCTLATDWYQCCPCPVPATQVEIALDPCLVEGDEKPDDLPLECQLDCFVMCEQCSPPDPPSCNDGVCESPI